MIEIIYDEYKNQYQINFDVIVNLDGKFDYKNAENYVDYNLEDDGESYEDVVASYTMNRSKIGRNLKGRKPYYKRKKYYTLREYQQFLVNCKLVFTSYGFKIFDEHFSDNDTLSFYFDSYKKSDLSDKNFRCILTVRISDHPLNKDYNHKRNRNIYYENKSEKLKYPKNKDKQYIEFINVLTNGHKSKDYRDALKYIDNQLNEILNDERYLDE